ncbi:MAG: diaminopimelate decarboxylase [Ignavibacteriales bacterium]|nr:diaminopimelate decarboxylase [Ignavibacteriales bacterium]
MNLLELGSFHYKEKKLYCEQKSVEEIAETVGTPVFIYSKNYLVNQYKEFDKAFVGINHNIFFAIKSNFNLNVIKILLDQGSGVDVNSGGELYRALKAGATPNKILFSGVGKTAEEIKMALQHGVKLIKAESLSETNLIDKIAGEMKKTAPVAIRINPNVDAKTHPYISTGLAENKFGIDSSKAEEIFLECSKLKNIRLCGIDMHIGSQITSIEPFVEAIEKMAELFKKLKLSGIPLQHFDIGGGMGVMYKEENFFSLFKLSERVKEILLQLDCEILFEPGRFLTANAGILVAEIQYIKQNRNKIFFIVDAAMTELLRPTLYGAYHHIQPVKINDRKDIIVDVVGPVCESGDFLAKDRTITECIEGEKLAVLSAGAYGMVMSSNYNARRRPPEVIVDGDRFFISRSRESFEHLLWDEKIIDELHT